MMVGAVAHTLVIHNVNTWRKVSGADASAVAGQELPVGGSAALRCLHRVRAYAASQPCGVSSVFATMDARMDDGPWSMLL
jgi:hypothetical protein